MKISDWCVNYDVGFKLTCCKKKIKCFIWLIIQKLMLFNASLIFLQPIVQVFFIQSKFKFSAKMQKLKKNDMVFKHTPIFYFFHQVTPFSQPPLCHTIRNTGTNISPSLHVMTTIFDPPSRASKVINNSIVRPALPWCWSRRRHCKSLLNL